MTTERKRLLTLGAIGVASFAAVAVAIWFFAWRPVRYVDRAHGYSIRFSAEWVLKGEGEGATVRAYREAWGALGVINVLASGVENLPDAAAYKAWYLRLNKEKDTHKEFSPLAEGARRVGGDDAAWTLFTYKSNAGDILQVWQVFLVRKSRGIIISCVAPPRVFERFRLDFEEAVDSFTFE